MPESNEQSEGAFAKKREKLEEIANKIKEIDSVLNTCNTLQFLDRVEAQKTRAVFETEYAAILSKSVKERVGLDVFTVAPNIGPVCQH